MSEDDLKSVLALYQQKSFELFNSNIVLEAQVKTLQNKINLLLEESEKSKRTKRNVKNEEDFE